MPDRYAKLRPQPVGKPVEGYGGEGRRRLRRIGLVQVALLVPVKAGPERLRRDDARRRLPGLDQDRRIFRRRCLLYRQMRQQG